MTFTHFFKSNKREKLVKYRANAKQHSEAERLLLKIILIFHPCYHPKTIGQT